MSTELGEIAKALDFLAEQIKEKRCLENRVQEVYGLNLDKNIKVYVVKEYLWQCKDCPRSMNYLNEYYCTIRNGSDKKQDSNCNHHSKD
jgi:hypothetical protein